ncbi:MAG: sortase [Ruminococcus sp.]|nr:sortase [Ruminococcus sp.]
MSYQNRKEELLNANARSRDYIEDGDYGKRYRKDDSYDADRSEQTRVYYQDRNDKRQSYDNRSRQRRDPYYDNRSRQRGYDSRDRYDDSYDSRSRQRSYNDRERYNDSYDSRSRQKNYDNRYDERYDDRYDSRQYNKKPKKSSGGGSTAVIVIAIIVLIAGLGIVGFKLYQYYTANKNHSNLQALSGNYDELYAMNNDFFGWIKIEDTDINYPVMFSPDEPERYLHMNFDGDYSESGELFVDGYCDPNGYHYLVYGHHMNNGTMFGSLPNYADEDFYNAHQTIRFDTRDELGEYEVFAVFYSKVYDESEEVFKYYEYANLDNESDYYTFVENVKYLSIYDTGITPVYGDKILTLSTCNYHTDDGRFVVCAKKIA